MKLFCPNCEKISEVEFINSNEEFEIRGETFKVDVKYFKCAHCGDEFDDPSSDYDPIEIAYDEYRKIHGYVQPNDIKDFRKKYGLTQAEFSKLLGFGGATLSRYENGALQDEAHNIILKMAMETSNLLKRIKESDNIMSEDRKNEIISEIESGDNKLWKIENAIIECFGAHEPSEFSGFSALNIDKFINAVLYFCKEGIYKTILCKFLFYSDFLHCKSYSSSITGLEYAHAPRGPVPDGFEPYFELLVSKNYLELKESFYKENPTFKYLSIIEPDFNVFQESELRCLFKIKNVFSGWTAKKISDYSHKENAYKQTVNGELISYKYAETLQLELSELNV